MKAIFSLLLITALTLCQLTSCDKSDTADKKAASSQEVSSATEDKPDDTSSVEDEQVRRLSAQSSTVVEVTSTSVYNSFSGKEAPSNAILYLDDDLFVTAEDGLYVPFEAAEAMCKDRIVPVFYVKTQKAATALGKRLNEDGITNCIVMSDNAELVKSVRTACPSISGAVDMRENKLDDDISYLIKLRDTANTSYAKIILLGSHATHRQIVYLQERLMTVWVEAENETVTAHCDAFTKGANGVVSEHNDRFFKALELFETDTMFREVSIVGHRGQPATNADNSLSGAKAAVKSGADAVECDIFLTADMEFVILHSDDIAYYTGGKGSPDELTTYEVQFFILKGTEGEHIPKLAEFFEEFRNQDIMHTIEIKTTYPDTVYLLRDLIAQCGVSHQVNIISFNLEQLKLSRKVIPEVSCGYLGTVNGEKGDIAATLNKYNISYHPSRGNVSAEKAYELNNRGIGIGTWTYSSKDTLYADILNGYASLTTDGALWAKDVVTEIVPKENYSVKVGAETEFVATAKTKSGEKQIVCEPIVVEGDIAFQKSENGYTPTKGSQATVILKYSQKLGEKTVYYYSPSVKLNLE